MRYQNRSTVGRLLARRLFPYSGQATTVFSLPSGGVVVGAEIARMLHAHLDVLLSHPVGHPLSTDYAVCAVTPGGYIVCDEGAVKTVDIPWLVEQVQKGQAQARRRQAQLRSGRDRIAPPRIAIVADDGEASGLSLIAALEELKEYQPHFTIMAMPVVPDMVVEQLAERVDLLLSLQSPHTSDQPVDGLYEEFPLVSAEEVERILEESESYS
jgi:putative phosphoribosyl transferase